MMPVSEPITETHPHVGCVRKAVEATFGMFPQAEPSFAGSGERPISGENIVGIVALMGGCPASLMLCLPRDTASGIAACFAGFAIPFESDDMGDIVGELCNILAGSVTAHLEDIGVHAGMSLPTVLRGRELSLPLTEGVQRVSLHFTTLSGDFTVALAAGNPHAALARLPGA